MRTLIQRVKSASVEIDGKTIGKIENGILIFLGITQKDTEKEAQLLVEKIANLRIFPKDEKELDQSLLDIKGEVLIVSQFTLYGSCDKGRRPDFNDAAKPEIANPLYEKFIDFFKKTGVKVESGQFGANMQVNLTNDGPCTLSIERTCDN